MAQESMSLASKDNSGLPVHGEHDGWSLDSNSAVRPTEEQIKTSLGADPTPAEPVVEAEPGAEPVEEVAAEAEPTDEVVEEVEPEPAKPIVAKPVTEPVKPKKLTRAEQINKDIAALTRQRGDITRETESAKQQRDALSAEIRELETKRTALTAEPAKPVVATDPKKSLNTAPKPRWSEFEAAGKTFDQFQDEADAWQVEEARLVARQETETVNTTREAAARDASAHERLSRAEEQINADLAARYVTARAKHADVDFDALIAQPLPIHETQPGYRPLRDIMRISDVGPELLMFFHEHPDESTRIASLQPWAALREMARLEERVTTAHSGSVVARPVTSAHAPIKPVRGSAPIARDGGPKSFDDMPFGADYLSASNKQLGVR